MGATIGEPIIMTMPRPRTPTASIRTATRPGIILTLEAIPIIGNTGHGHS